MIGKDYPQLVLYPNVEWMLHIVQACRDVYLHDVYQTDRWVNMPEKRIVLNTEVIWERDYDTV